MKIKVTAVVTDAVTNTGDPHVSQFNLNVSAVDVDDYSHRLATAVCYAGVDSTLSVDALNDAIIAAVVATVEGSTVGTTNGWTVDRGNILVSGLPRRA